LRSYETLEETFVRLIASQENNPRERVPFSSVFNRIAVKSKCDMNKIFHLRFILCLKF